MTNNERIKILKELRDFPITTMNKKVDRVEESLNWAIKICQKYESKRKDNKNGIKDKNNYNKNY